MIDVSFNLHKETKAEKPYPKIMRSGGTIALLENVNYGMILASPKLSEIGSIVSFHRRTTWRDFDEPITIANRQP